MGDAPGEAREAVEVEVRIEISSAALCATITDTAEAGEVPLAQVTMPDEWQESGRGLALAIEVLDELRHESSNGNTWHLRRRRRG